MRIYDQFITFGFPDLSLTGSRLNRLFNFIQRFVDNPIHPVIAHNNYCWS